MFISHNNRAGISYDVHHLSCFLVDPKEEHNEATTRVLCYIKSSPVHDRFYSVLLICSSKHFLILTGQLARMLIDLSQAT